MTVAASATLAADNFEELCQARGGGEVRTSGSLGSEPTVVNAEFARGAVDPQDLWPAKEPIGAGSAPAKSQRIARCGGRASMKVSPVGVARRDGPGCVSGGWPVDRTSRWRVWRS